MTNKTPVGWEEFDKYFPWSSFVELDSVEDANRLKNELKQFIKQTIQEKDREKERIIDRFIKQEKEMKTDCTVRLLEDLKTSLFNRE